eukprot:gene12222-5808_t
MEEVKKVLKDHQIVNYEFVDIENVKTFHKTLLIKDKLKNKTFAVVLNSKFKLNLKNAKKYLNTTSKVSIVQEKDLNNFLKYSEVSPILLHEEKMSIIFDKNLDDEICISSGNSKFALKIKLTDLDSVIKINQFDLCSNEESDSIVIQFHTFNKKFQKVSQLEMLQIAEKQKIFYEGELLTKDFKIKKLMNIWTDNETPYRLFDQINKLESIDDEIKFQEIDEFEVDFIKEISKELHLTVQYLKHEPGYFNVRKFKQINVSCILDNFLFLGCWKDAKNIKSLEAMKITRILNVTNDIHKNHSNFIVKNISILDTPKTNISKYFDESFDFIDDALKKKEKILVHCHAGRSRSATIVIAYLMKHQQISLKEAVEYVKLKRKIIRPNDGFMKQLKTFEQNYFQ